ncbi:MAG: hypothetical protein Q4F05_08475 [bacterium]|nr:hypothetical protein [bacterium]
MLYTEIVKCLQTYARVYRSIGIEPKARDDIRKEWKEEKTRPSDSTIKNYLDKAFSGDLPMIKIQNDKATIDELQVRSFIEDLCKALGTDVAILFSGPMPMPKGRREKDARIPAIDGVESPVVKNLKKELSNQKNEFIAKQKELQEQLRDKNDVIVRLQRLIQEDVSKSILTEMDKKIVVLSSLESKPEEVFQRDFFLDKPSKLLECPNLLSKCGGERQSFYQNVAISKVALTTKSYCKRVAEILCKSKFFEHRAKDVKHLLQGKKTEQDIQENRKQSIQMILQDQNMSNQMKLSLYAGWHEYHGTEMEDLLNFAGDHCIDANFVITLLEHPKDYNNYENVRGFLRQACKASEARMKREAAKELIAGDWYVIAEYHGIPCRFQMMPVDELMKFRNALLTNAYGEAAIQLEKSLSTVRAASFEENHPDNKMVVTDVGIRELDNEYFNDAKTRIHEVEKEYQIDVHTPINDGDILDDFTERESEKDGK